MGNITSSSSKESIPTTKQENTKQDVASSIHRGGRDSADERVAKRPRFAENDHVNDDDKVHEKEGGQKHTTNTISPSLTAHSIPGRLLYGSNNCSSTVVDEASAAATFEEETSAANTPTPSLVGMPASIIIKIIQYSTGHHISGCISPDFRPDILALERTCKTFRDLLAKDETWLKIIGDNGDVYKHTPTHRERAFIPISLSNIRMYQESTKNLLLEHLGGADGVRHIATLLLMKVSEDFHMDSNGHCIHSEDEVKVVLRGDTIDYLTEVIQGHMINRLEKANLHAIESLRPNDGYPGITERDLRLMDGLTLTGEGASFLHCSVSRDHHNCKLISNDDCSDEQILSDEERRALVRALAYRAGVVKLSGEVFSIVATEVLHHMAVLISNAYEECWGQHPCSCTDHLDNPLYVNREESDDEGGASDERTVWDYQYSDHNDMLNNQYYFNHCPPLQADNDGNTNFVIIPRAIKNAAERMGMRPLLGYAYDIAMWAARDEDKKEEEAEEEMDRYYLAEVPQMLKDDYSSDAEVPEQVQLPEPESDDSVISLLEIESLDSAAEEENDE